MSWEREQYKRLRNAARLQHQIARDCRPVGSGTLIFLGLVLFLLFLIAALSAVPFIT